VHHFFHFLSRKCFVPDVPIGMHFLVDDRWNAYEGRSVVSYFQSEHVFVIITVKTLLLHV